MPSPRRWNERLTPWNHHSAEDSKRRVAEKRIAEKYKKIGGAPGAPKTPGDGGLLVIGNNFVREYTNGKIYYSYNHVEEPLFVYGGIGDKYTQLDGPNSWLGWPTSDQQPFAQDGRASTFEKGAIYWWPDTGAIELGNVVVRYKGLYCFGETNEISESDEPYVIFGVVPSPPAQASDVMTQIYTEVDSKDSRPDNLELYRGLPYGMALAGTLCEHDHGDPNKYLEQVKVGVAQAGAGVAAGVAAIPIAGPLLAAAAVALLAEYGSDIAKFVNGILGTDDDIIEKWLWNVTAKDMVKMARAPRLSFCGIDYHLESKLLSDGESSYKVYLDVEAV
jgi:LGFP repeat